MAPPSTGCAIDLDRTRDELMPTPPLDNFHRRIDYMRLSITDRCNLRCVYCMPATGVPPLAHEQVLSYEDILRLARIAVSLGICKVRITGGEPLVRRDVVYLCEQIAKLPEIESVSLTTNGVLLEQFAAPLFAAGIRRINVSLDTLDRAKFSRITRRDRFQQVWAGIEEAHRIGFYPIKINVVALRGTNDDELEALARLTHRFPFHVRFIEFMPFQAKHHADLFLGSDEILERLQRIAPLHPVHSNNSNGPARHFQFPGAPGKIGIISPVTHHFCATCNRMRVTADGKLRTCLFSQKETDLRELLRSSAPDDVIAATVRRAIAEKPERHSFDQTLTRKCISRPMSAIGG